MIPHKIDCDLDGYCRCDPGYVVQLGKRKLELRAPSRLDARITALRSWFGASCYWDCHETKGPTVGRVVLQQRRKRHGKIRFIDKPLTRWEKLTIRRLP